VVAESSPTPTSEPDPALAPTLHWSSEEIASFVTSTGRGRVLLVRPGARGQDPIEAELRRAGYRVGRLPVTREVSHLPVAAATFLPDLVYVGLDRPYDPCIAALELFATDPRTGWLPLVAIVGAQVSRAVVTAAYERSGCDFLSAGAAEIELLARTHLLVRLAKALAQTGRAPVLGPPEVEVANAPAGDCRFLTDPETGVHTRTYFDHRLPAEIARARRYQRPLSLLVVLVRGAAEDPGVAAEAGAILTRRVRTCDVVARVVPDGFAILLPETSVDAAGILAARVRCDFEARDRRVCIGLAGLDEPRGGAHTPAALVETALARARDERGG